MGVVTSPEVPQERSASFFSIPAHVVTKSKNTIGRHQYLDKTFPNVLHTIISSCKRYQKQGIEGTPHVLPAKDDDNK